MRILAALIVAFVLVFSALSLVTSNSAPVAQIAYGDTTSGRLNDQVFEWIYEFEGETGDIILIELLAQPGTHYLDPEFYLIAPNDNYISSNIYDTSLHRYLLFTLQQTGMYTVVVERYGGRRADGTGEFELSLNLVNPRELESAWDGVLNADMPQGFHLFHARGTGTFRIELDSADAYSPAIQMMYLVPGQGSLPTIGRVDVASMGSINFEMELQRGTLYVVLVYGPHNRQTNGTNTLSYSIHITPVDVQSFW